MLQRSAQIAGWGMCVPTTVRTNHDLAKMVDTSHQWIVERTGIEERRIAAADETTSGLATEAARQALTRASITAHDVDLVIVATATADFAFPATACLVQDALGAQRAGAFDLSVGCAGFVYGLVVASQMIMAGGITTALVIGAETLSKILDWSDRETCVLFGDGAGAVVLRAANQAGGLMGFTLGADGSGGPLLSLPGGGTRMGVSAATLEANLHTVKMNGREVFKFATRTLGRSVRQAAAQAGIAIDEIDLLLPHQANLRIIDAAVQHLALSESKVFVNIQRYGNTSSASIPIALCEAISTGRVRRGDRLAMAAFGAGLAWAAAVVQFGTGLSSFAPPLTRVARRVHQQDVSADAPSSLLAR